MQYSLADCIQAHPLAFTIVGIGGVLVGYMLKVILPTRKEKHEIGQDRFQNTQILTEQRTKAFKDFCDSISEIDGKRPTREQLNKMTVLGDVYFGKLEVSAIAVLDGNISTNASTAIKEAVSEAVEKSMPAYFKRIAKLSAKLDIPSSHTFREADYPNIVKLYNQGNGPRITTV